MDIYIRPDIDPSQRAQLRAAVVEPRRRTLEVPSSAIQSSSHADVNLSVWFPNRNAESLPTQVWTDARLSKPRRGKSRARGPVRTTDLPVLSEGAAYIECNPNLASDRISKMALIVFRMFSASKEIFQESVDLDSEKLAVQIPPVDVELEIKPSAPVLAKIVQMDY
ncbi:hypothetical protein T265_06852 [Opisthorchis viverrini]|uniref:Uncharacterized protein n=1 Tax=Opisthorchis viverrini TaxID=6198 RepID=A0A074ZEZ0_OPIVI|nr:hypothetical protein T265_06852 [Opisthorchis viverrini]KER25748.1 hypothetical protein T265_06852 [Opisthorchis viverrini]